MNIIRKLRKDKGITQEELGLVLNVQKAAISKYELGIANPSPDILKKLSSYFNVTTDYLLNNKVISKQKKAPTQGIKIPVLGQVVAGVPVEAITDMLDYEEIHPDLAATGDFFALRVKGASMEPLFIEGDTVIVRSQPSIESGETAIVLVNGSEATIKKITIKDNGIMLIGYNTSIYEPHFYSNEEIQTLPVSIIGKVVELRRSI